MKMPETITGGAYDVLSVKTLELLLKYKSLLLTKLNFTNLGQEPIFDPYKALLCLKMF